MEKKISNPHGIVCMDECLDLLANLYGFDSAAEFETYQKRRKT
jgi:hypothetical protein